MFRMLALACAFAVSAGPVSAQQTPVRGALGRDAAYGAPITLDQAKRVVAAAELEAAKNSWQVGITILDSGGNMIMFRRVDNAQLSATPCPRPRRAPRAGRACRTRGYDGAIAAGGAELVCGCCARTSRPGAALRIVVNGQVAGACAVRRAVVSRIRKPPKSGPTRLPGDRIVSGLRTDLDA